MRTVVIFVILILSGFLAYLFLSGEEVVKREVASSEAVSLEEYTISVEARPLSASVVHLDVDTNIPLPIDVMASVSAKNQSPNDVYIGFSKRVRLTSPKQTIEMEGEGLPSGDYTADVTFYPDWGAKDGPREAKSITNEIIGVDDVTLGGAGESIEEADRRNNAQRWVMMNVSSGTPWDATLFVEKLGDFQKTEAALNLHDAYYFPVADMTIIVSRLKNTVTTWRDGNDGG
ncbi:hypothetical protein JYP52_21335 [Nitratireductor aquibiodomus]|uniref:hypothetical protein n=1 Tax=Nitratireductor TaxID=245876 RepID=UPI000DDF814E|nr:MULTISPECIES: hypothetical protein [Nitratireductor]MBN7763685.1 hypothetical protein [Nitratireductor aquibiodomus]